MSSKRTERRLRLQLARSIASSGASSPPKPKVHCPLSLNSGDSDSDELRSSSASVNVDLDGSTQCLDADNDDLCPGELHSDISMDNPDFEYLSYPPHDSRDDNVEQLLDCGFGSSASELICSSSESDSMEGAEEVSSNVSELKQMLDAESVCSSPLLANVVIMSVMKKHHLTYACQADILQLLSILCPSLTVPSSVYMLNQYFVDLKKDVVMHYCCSSCKALVGNSTVPNCCDCPCIDCKFIEVPLSIQLADRFKGMAKHVQIM